MEKNSPVEQKSLHINIFEEQRKMKILHKGVKRLIRLVAQQEDFFTPASCSVVFIRDTRMREINRSYRGADEPTDVLSFACLDRLEGTDHPRGGESGEQELGDIFISVDTMIRNANEDRREVWLELTALVVHGFLHLLGYEHETEEEATEMFAKQDAYVKSFAKNGNTLVRERTPTVNPSDRDRAGVADR